MGAVVSRDDLSDGKVIELLEQHLQEMHKYSPPESIHALDTEKMKDSTLSFWSARLGQNVIGCGALKELGEESAEIKSMKTSDAYLRKGVGAIILAEILQEAKNRRYKSVYLETGTHSAFDPSVCMYKKLGFIECGPFGGYKSDPYSRFFTKLLEPSIRSDADTIRVHF